MSVSRPNMQAAERDPERSLVVDRSNDTEPRVIFIVGSGRSGSTLLGRVLGQLPGVAYVGETDLLWGTETDAREPPWGLPIGRRCGCGLAIANCDLWSKALSLMAHQLGTVEEGELGPAILSLSRRVAFSKLGIPAPRRFGTHTDEVGYTQAMSILYRAIATAAGAEVIIDSSKRRFVANLAVELGTRSPVSMVQIVRRPGATVHSWNAHRYFDAAGVAQMAHLGVINASLRWNISNIRAELIARRLGPKRALHVRYEDLGDRPEYLYAAVAGRLGLPGAFIPIRDSVASLEPCHTVGGHPTRFEAGDRSIEAHDEFRSELGRFREAISEAITFPVARRYGYRPNRGEVAPKPVDLRTRASGAGTSLRVVVVGGIYGLPDSVRRERSMTPETVLERGLRERGVTVLTASHGWSTQRWDADVVHVHHLGKGAVSQLMPRNPPLVFTRHDVADLKLSRQVALKAVLLRAKAVVALSPVEKMMLCRHLPADRIHLISNGVPDDLWPFRTRSVPAEDAPWSVLYAGQLIRIKNVDVLIRAIALLNEDRSVTLRLAYHNPSLEQPLKKLANDLGMGDRIVFLGPRNTTQLCAEYARANLLVLPSASEAFPSVITEAMMSGLPVVATEVGGVPDQLAGHGTLAPAGDSRALAAAMSQVMVNYGDALERARRGESFARRHYSVDAMIDAHLDLYYRLRGTGGESVRSGPSKNRNDSALVRTAKH